MTLDRLPRYVPAGMPDRGHRAVVLGASMAGLLVARVLADAFTEVVVVERDGLPADGGARSGVPQARHPHLLLQAGQETIEDLFPGFIEGLLSNGALLLDWTTDLRYYDEGGYIASGPRRIPMYAGSRPLFEGEVRRQLRGRDGVEVRPDRSFAGYRLDGSAIDGVELRRGGESATTLDADLVVDAMGRASPTVQELDRLGFETPPVDEVTIDVVYSTAQLERPADDRRMVFIPPSPPRTFGGGAFPVEGDRWLVTMVGIHGTQPPGSVDDFAGYAADLEVDDLHALVESHEWVDAEPARYPFPSSRWRHYEATDGLPADLLVLGDAVASFNPIYGQGMSIAAMEAVQLHHLLRSAPPADIQSAFFDRVATTVALAWRLSVGSDFRFEETTGPKPFGTDLFNRYLSRLMRRAHTDGELATEFADVAMMATHPRRLFHPAVLGRVLGPAW